MKTVYKFCGNHGLGILSDLELKVTPPNEFNDPFEFTPKMRLSDPVRYVKRILRNESILKALCESDPPSCGVRAYLDWARRNPDKIIEQLLKVLLEVVSQNEKDFLSEVSKEFGILCMSGLRSKILMWGHYCDKPLGLVIGFDGSHTVFQQGIMGLRPVELCQKADLL